MQLVLLVLSTKDSCVVRRRTSTQQQTTQRWMLARNLSSASNNSLQIQWTIKVTNTDATVQKNIIKLC